MSPTKKTITQIRQALRRDMRACSEGEIVTKTVHFSNEDVPRFLEKLSEYEKRSRDVRLTIK